jgi:hypothetical protein
LPSSTTIAARLAMAVQDSNASTTAALGSSCSEIDLARARLARSIRKPIRIRYVHTIAVQPNRNRLTTPSAGTTSARATPAASAVTSRGLRRIMCISEKRFDMPGRPWRRRRDSTWPRAVPGRLSGDRL